MRLRFQHEGRIRGHRIRPAEVPTHSGWLGYKSWHKFAKTILVVPGSSFSVRQLKTLKSVEPQMTGCLPAELRSRYRVHHCALLSLSPLMSARIESVLSQFYPLGTMPGRWWFWAKSDQVLYLHVIDKIRSLDEFAMTFRGLLKTIGRGT